MNINRLLSMLILAAALLAGAVPATAQSTDADRLLRAASDRFYGSGSVSMDFTADAGAEGSMTGTATFCGPSFTIDSPAVRLWYDGTTQWTLLKGSGEVNITEPLPEEIAQTNPFAILSAYSNTFRARRLPDADGATRIELTPLGSGDAGISRAVVSIGADGWISGATVMFDDGRELSARITRLSAGPALDQARFRFKAADFPGVTVVDLR